MNAYDVVTVDDSETQSLIEYYDAMYGSFECDAALVLFGIGKNK